VTTAAHRLCGVVRSFGVLGSSLWLFLGHALAAGSLPELVELGRNDAAFELIAAGADVNEKGAGGTTALVWAAHHHEIELVRALLKRGADAKAKTDYGVTPISAAAVEGDYEIIKALLEAGADVESPNPEGQTVLMVVARTGRVDTARLLLAHGANVNAIEQWGGQSALMWAAAQQQPEMVRTLIAAGANVDAHGRAHDWQRLVTAEPRTKILYKGGFTPLLYAARSGCVECIDALVAGAADINLSDPYGITPLVLALLNRNFDTAMRLIELGADVNRWDWWGRAPLFVAVELTQVPNSSRGDLPSLDNATGFDVAKALLERGANVNMRLKQQLPLRSAPNDRGSLDGSPDAFVLAIGATPLHAAAKAGDEKTVRLLLEHGADVRARNVFGITPMLAAAGVGHRYAVLRETPILGAFKTGQDALLTVKALHEAGAPLDEVAIGTHRVGGMTAAHGAAQEGWSEVIEYLHDVGADINRPSEDKSTPRALAMAAGHGDTVALIDKLLGTSSVATASN
jgi:serine/threonine-protein phosphatase 6 regulatory ankyrin repeat subunit B